MNQDYEFMVPSLSLEEIEILAQDLCDDKVFTTLDYHMDQADHKMISIVFQEFLIMSDRQRKLFNMFPPAMLYEYLDQATYKPSRFGGTNKDILGKYPMFSTMKCLNYHDTEILIKIVKEKLKIN